MTAPAVGPAIQEAEAAALLINNLGAELIDGTLPEWSREQGSLANFMAGLVLQARLAPPAVSVPTVSPVAAIQALVARWSPWAQPAASGASSEEVSYRSAVAAILAELTPLVSEGA